MTFKRVTLLLCASSALAVVAVSPAVSPVPSPQSCVPTGSWPSQLAAGSPVFSTTFHATYVSSWLKVVSVTAFGATRYYALRRGDGTCVPPPPTTDALITAGVVPAGTTAVSHFVVPLANISLASTTQIAPIEALGKRDSIVGVEGSSYVASPCLSARISSGLVTNLLTSFSSSLSLPELSAVGAAAFFCSTGAWANCPGTPADVVYPDNAETMLLGVAELIKFTSLFFNAEALAESLFSAQASRLACATSQSAGFQKTFTVSGGRTPAVLWAYLGPFDGLWYTGSSGTYYGNAITAAGGSLLTVPECEGGCAAGSEAFASAASRADVWLYANDNAVTNKYGFPQWSLAALRANASAPGGAAVAASPAVATALWDFTKSGVDSWFQDRPASPETLVQDLVSLLFDPVAATCAFNHSRVWWRNVNVESTGVVAPPSVGGLPCNAPPSTSGLLSSTCAALTPNLATCGTLPTPSRSPRAATHSKTPSRRASPSLSHSRPASSTKTPTRSKAPSKSHSASRQATHSRSPKATK